MKLNEMTIDNYSQLLAAKLSVPGGGSCLALCLELACDLGLMTLRFSQGKKECFEYEDELKSLEERLIVCKSKAHEIIDEDGVAYKNVMASFKTKDSKEIEKACLYACEVPYTLYCHALEVRKMNQRLMEIGNKNLVSDAAIGAELCAPILSGCKKNIICNLPYISEKDQQKYKMIL